MAIIDYDAATGAYYEIGANIHDYNAITGAFYPLASIYDYDAVAGSHHKVWDASYTVTLTNTGRAAGTIRSWSDSGGIIWRDVIGKASGRTWVYFDGGGWAYGDTYAALVIGSGSSYTQNLIGEWNLLSGVSGWVQMKQFDAIVNNTNDLIFHLRKVNASQGSYGMRKQVMCVPLAPIENAIGRQITVQEAWQWIGYGWSGSKTISITP